MFVYFPPTDQFVLFGGASERGSYRDDMWLWDGQGWKNPEVAGPSARGFSAAAYHPGHKMIFLHGGRGDDRQTFGDLWAWDGTRWQQLDDDSPFSSDHHEMAYVPDLGGLLLYGGWTGDGVTAQTWLWDGEWTLIADLEQAPSPRSAFGMSYNPVRRQVELYGGLWLNGQYADSWAWKDGRWQLLSGPYENSSLDHLTMFFDQAMGETLVFGGKDYRYRMQGVTRRFASGGLVETIAETGPEPRHSAHVAYDTERNRGVLFGGKIYKGDQQLPLDDMWVWENSSWHRIYPRPVTTRQ